MKNKLLHFMISSVQITVYAPESNAMSVAAPTGTYSMSVQQCNRLMNLFTDKISNDANEGAKNLTLDDAQGNISLLHTLNMIIINKGAFRDSLNPNHGQSLDRALMLLQILNSDCHLNVDRFADQIYNHVMDNCMPTSPKFDTDLYFAQPFVLGLTDETKFANVAQGILKTGNYRYFTVNSRAYLGRVKDHMTKYIKSYGDIQTIEEQKQWHANCSKFLTRGIIDSFNVLKLFDACEVSPKIQASYALISRASYVKSIISRNCDIFVGMYEIFLSDNFNRYISKNESAIDVIENVKQVTLESTRDIIMPTAMLDWIGVDPMNCFDATVQRLSKYMRVKIRYNLSLLDNSSNQNLLVDMLQNIPDKISWYINKLNGSENFYEVFGQNIVLPADEHFKILCIDAFNIFTVYKSIENPTKTLIDSRLRSTIHIYLERIINNFNITYSTADVSHRVSGILDEYDWSEINEMITDTCKAHE